MTDGLTTTRDVLDLSRHGSLEDAVAHCLIRASGNSLGVSEARDQARGMIRDAEEQRDIARSAWAHRRGHGRSKR